MSLRVNCPRCGCEWEVSDLLEGQVREELRKQLEADASEKYQDLAKREAKLQQAKDQFERLKSQQDAEVQKQVDTRLADLKKEAQRVAEEGTAAQISSLAEQLSAAREKVRIAEAAELELRKERAQLAEDK